MSVGSKYWFQLAGWDTAWEDNIRKWTYRRYISNEECLHNVSSSEHQYISRSEFCTGRIDGQVYGVAGKQLTPSPIHFFTLTYIFNRFMTKYFRDRGYFCSIKKLSNSDPRGIRRGSPNPKQKNPYSVIPLFEGLGWTIHFNEKPSKYFLPLSSKQRLEKIIG